MTWRDNGYSGKYCCPVLMRVRLMMITALLALIAAIGSWIALQQMLIARTKLNNDLFDRRFAIYWATRIYIQEMLQHKGATQEDAVKWWTAAAGAPFLFEKDRADYIKEISDRGSEIRGTINGKPLYESSEGVAQYNENYMWFINCFERLEDRFHDNLSLLKLEPLSARRLISSRPFKGGPSIRKDQ